MRFLSFNVPKALTSRRIDRGNFLLHLHDWRRCIVIALPRREFGPPLV